jgi:opacity protein-like surface antigen
MINRNFLIALITSSAIGFSLSSFSQPGYSGVYVGGQLGWGQASHNDLHWIDNQAEKHHHKINQDGLAGRGYLGFQLSPNFGLETGITGFSNNHGIYSHEKHAKDSHSHEHWKVRSSQWDLLGRIGTPFSECGFRGDLKLGVASVFANNHSNDHGHHHTQFGPAAGAGIGYNFDRHVAMDVSYLHVFNNLNSHHQHSGTPKTDLVTLGVSYLFF